MKLPSDTPRQLANIVSICRVTKVDLSSSPAKVKVELENGIESDWIPFGNAFIGGTRIVAAPKVGVSGLLVSEGGELEVMRFIPCFLTESNDVMIGSDEFIILLNNGDSIHHKGANLTINVSGQSTINASGSSTINTPNQTINADGSVTLNTPTTNITGTLNLSGAFNHLGDGEGGGKPAEMKHGANAEGSITVTGGDVVADGVSLKALDKRISGLGG